MSARIPEPGVHRALIDDLLYEQQLLTPVARFSRKHEQNELPAQAKYYRDLVPLSSPRHGEQYAFAVDLDACTGCKACVTACHNLNGLDDEETWRDVGALFGGTLLEPIQQSVTTACHHCADPACLNGCPVKAYDKDPVTCDISMTSASAANIVSGNVHTTCTKYSKKRGIVRKCDMCSSRLAVGEAPACVQACPNEAIRITIVDKQQFARDWEGKVGFLPGAPDPDYTGPTTQYRTSKNLAGKVLPGDFFKSKPEHWHPPLILMLVLTQLSVGTLGTDTILRLLLFPAELMRTLTPFHSLVALLLGFLALGLSTLHLGRPLYAWRAVVGWRTSWLSREIIVFGLFVTLALIHTASSWLPGISRLMSRAPFGGLPSPALENVLGIGATLTGLAGVYCSTMIYRDTRRMFWRTRMTTPKFFGTTLLLGPATILFTMTAQSVLVPDILAQLAFHHVTSLLCQFLVVAMTAKLLWELAVFGHLSDGMGTNMRRTALLMSGELKSATIARFVCGALGGIVLPVLALSGSSLPAIGAGILTLSLLRELLERYLFFAAVVPSKMPGGIAS
ncbi:MAG: DmsC/YnfH family molybdoenzyme membrane anchor subunit [Chthoniobacterales bacterium]